ncbi:putative membrane protein (partial), partial [Candidatus Ichthyocystis hellenicum]
HIREEFDYWASNNHQQENPHHRVKRALDSPVASPSGSISDFVNLLQKNFGLLDQTSLDSYTASIQQSGFASDAAQEGFKKFLGVMSTVDRVYSLKNNDMANQGYELKYRIVASTYFDNPGYTKSYETTDPTSFEDAINVLKNIGVNNNNLRLITNDKILTNAFLVIKILNDKLVSELGEGHAFANQKMIDGNLLDVHVRASQELLASAKLQARFDKYFSSWLDGLNPKEQSMVMNKPEIKAPVKFTQDTLIEGGLLNTIMASGVCHGLSICFADSAHRYGTEHAVNFISDVDSTITKSIIDGQLKELTQLKIALHHLNNLAMTAGEMVQYQSPNFLAKADYKTQISAEEIYRLVLHRKVKEGAVFFIGVPAHVVVLVKGFTDAPDLIGRTSLLTLFDANLGTFPLLTRSQAITFLQRIIDDYCNMDRPSPLSPGDGRATIARYNPRFSDQVIPVFGNYPVRNVLTDVNKLIRASSIRRTSPLESLAAAVAGNVDPTSFHGRLLPSSAQISLAPSSRISAPQAESNVDTSTPARDLLVLRSTAAELYSHLESAIQKTGIAVEDALIDTSSLLREASEGSPNSNNNNNINVKIWSAKDAATKVTAKPGTETYRAQLELFFQRNSNKVVAVVKVKMEKLHKLYQITKIAYPATKIDMISTKFSGLVFDIMNLVNLYEMHKYLYQIQHLPEADRALFTINYAASVIDMVCASAQWSAVLTEQLSTLTASSFAVAARVAERSGSVIAAASIGSSVGSMIAGGINVGFAIKSMTEAQTTYQFGKATADLTAGLSSVGLGIIGLAFPGFGTIIAAISLTIVALKYALTKYFQQATVGFYKATAGFCKTDMEIKAIIELLLSRWIKIEDGVISFKTHIPINHINISGDMVSATKTDNSFQLRMLYDSYYRVHSRLSPQQIAKVRFSFDRMLEKKPISIKRIYPRLNLKKVEETMKATKYLSMRQNNSPETKILILPQGKPVVYYPTYEAFTFGTGAPDRNTVLNKFKYIRATARSQENFFRVPPPNTIISKYYPLITYSAGLGGILAVSYDRGYHDNREHETFVTVGPGSPALMIPPALDLPVNQIGVTGVMSNSWDRDALTREYTVGIKHNSTAVLIVNPNANVKFRHISVSSKIAITELYPGQIEEIRIIEEYPYGYQLILEMKPTPVEKSKQKSGSPNNSPFDQWKNHLPECNLKDPDPKDHDTNNYDSLAGRSKTRTKVYIPNWKIPTLTLTEGIDSESKKEYHSLTCSTNKDGVNIEFVGKPMIWLNETETYILTKQWTVGQAKEIRKEVVFLLGKKIRTGLSPSPHQLNIAWKKVTPVYDLTCRSDKDAFVKIGWMALPKNLTDSAQKQDDIYPELKEEHVIPVCLSSEVRNRYGNFSKDWKDLELIWIQEPQINDRAMHKNDKWKEFGTYYFFDGEKKLLLEQIDDHPVQPNQVSVSHIHPKQLINAIANRAYIVPGETEFVSQEIDGGFNGELLIATKEVATNENFINKTLEAHEIHPNSTILVPQIPLVSQNQNTTEKNHTLIQTTGKERFMVPLYDGHDQHFVGTLNYNNTKIALIKSTTPARSKR